MRWKITVMTLVMGLLLGGAAFARQGTDQADGLAGPEGGAEQVQSFTGVLEKEGEDYLLMVGERSYRIEIDDEERVEQLLGQEVEVRGIVEEETIHAEAVAASHDVGVGPGAGEQSGEQPMSGQEPGQELEQETGQETGQEPGQGLGPGGVYPPGWQPQ